MCRRHKIKRLGTCVLQSAKNLCKPVFRQFCALPVKTDLPVLTKKAAKRTAGKENRTGTVLPGKTRFLPLMQRRCGNAGDRPAAAASEARRSVRAAKTRAETTVLIFLFHPDQSP